MLKSGMFKGLYSRVKMQTMQVCFHTEQNKIVTTDCNFKLKRISYEKFPRLLGDLFSLDCAR
jgi:hypothetical protein